MEDEGKTLSPSTTSCFNPFSVTMAASKSTFTTDIMYGLCVVTNARLCSEPFSNAFLANAQCSLPQVFETQDTDSARAPL